MTESPRAQVPQKVPSSRGVRLAQTFGIAVCVAIFVAWLVLGFSPIRMGNVTVRTDASSDPNTTHIVQRTERYGAPGWTGPMALMAGLAVLGAVAAAFRLPSLMYAVFVFSFFPIGAYMLGAPRGWPVGVLDLLLLLSAVALHVLLRRERTERWVHARHLAERDASGLHPREKT